jgi:hypothetical protein
MIMVINPEDFFRRFSSIKELYLEVKEAIILAENFDKGSDVYLSSLNELRNGFDRLMRSLDYPAQLSEEFDEAKEHLYKAGYDAYEVLAINVGNSIVKVVEEYDSGIISTIFPRYYDEIKPMLIDMRIELAGGRAHQKLNPTKGTKSFYPYKDQVTRLIQQLKFCEVQVPNLQAEKKRRSRKSLKTALIPSIITLVLTVAGTYAYEKWFKVEKAPIIDKGTSLHKDSAS